MISKEMAKDLFDKFYQMTHSGYMTELMRKQQVKAMCRICIEEILRACDQVYNSDMVHFRETGMGEWWLAVKSEVEKI